MTDNQLDILWSEFGNIPIDKDEAIEQEFITDGVVWPVGTDRFDIWHWFDQEHSKGVAWLSGCA